MTTESPHDLKIFSKPLPENASVLMGFPGSGLVGTIALQYMVEQLEFELIGTMTSKFFPPLAMMNKGVINDPVRIYIKNDIAAIVADIPIHPMICYETSRDIIDWLAAFKPKGRSAPGWRPRARPGRWPTAWPRRRPRPSTPRSPMPAAGPPTAAPSLPSCGPCWRCPTGSACPRLRRVRQSRTP